MVDKVTVPFEGQDRVTSVIDRIRGNVRKLGDEAEKTTKKTGQSFEDFAKKGAKAFAIIGAAAFAAKKAFDFAEQGAQLQRLSQSGTEIARQMGGSYDILISKLKESSLASVSNADLTLSANQAMMLGLGADADKLGQLMEIAAFRGRAMGVSTTQSFSDMVRGIGRMSPLILDNLGIVVDANKTFKEYADSIGKSTGELERADKIQALFNRVLEEGNRQLAEAGGLAADNATQFEIFKARTKDETDALKVLAGVIGGKLLGSINKVVEVRRVQDDLMAQGVVRHLAYSKALEIVSEQEKQLADIQDAKSFDNSIMGIRTLTEEYDQATEVQANYSKEHTTFLDMVLDVQGATDTYADTVTELDAALQAGKISQQEHTKAVLEAGQAMEEASGKMMVGLLRDMLASDAEGLTASDVGILLETYHEMEMIDLSTAASTVEIFNEAMGRAGIEGEFLNDTFKEMLTDVGATREGIADFQPVITNMAEAGPVGAAGVDVFRESVRGTRGAAMEARSTVQGLDKDIRALDGAEATANIFINVHGAVPRFGGRGSGFYGTGTGSNVIGGVSQFASGGSLKESTGWVAVGDTPGGGWTPYTELISPTGFVFDAETSRRIKESGLIRFEGRGLGGPIGRSNTDINVEGGGIRVSGRGRSSPRFGGGVFVGTPIVTSPEAVADAAATDADVPVTALAATVSSEVSRMGTAMTQSTVANVTATHQQTERQAAKTDELIEEVRGLREDGKRDRASRSDDMLALIQEYL